MFGFLKSRKKEILQIANNLREEVLRNSLSTYEQVFYMEGINFSVGLLYNLDSLADAFYDNISKDRRKETIANASRLYALKLAYMYYHWKGNLSYGGKDRKIDTVGLSEAVDHTIKAFWNTSEQPMVKKEFSVLYATYEDDNSTAKPQLTHNEKRLIYAKTMALFKNNNLDISAFETPLDAIDLIHLPSIPISERPIFLEAQTKTFDDMISVFEYHGLNKA